MRFVSVLTECALAYLVFVLKRGWSCIVTSNARRCRKHWLISVPLIPVSQSSCSSTSFVQMPHNFRNSDVFIIVLNKFSDWIILILLIIYLIFFVVSARCLLRASYVMFLMIMFDHILDCQRFGTLVSLFAAHFQNSVSHSDDVDSLIYKFLFISHSLSIAAELLRRIIFKIDLRWIRDELFQMSSKFFILSLVVCVRH